MNNMTAFNFFTRWSTFWSRKECEGGNQVKAYACRRDFGPLSMISVHFFAILVHVFDFGPLFRHFGPNSQNVLCLHVITSFTLFFGPKSGPRVQR